MRAGHQLGSLEKEIMDIMWDTCPCNVREVYERLQDNREIAYTTVMTVMTRLVEKGVLCRRKEGKAHIYDACTSRKDIAREQVKSFFDAVFERYEEDGLMALQEGVSDLPKEKQKILQNIFQK